jgi:hypothetical protein
VGAEFDWSRIGVVEPDPEPAPQVEVVVPDDAGEDSIPF